MKPQTLVCLTPKTGAANRYVRGADGVIRLTHAAVVEAPMDVSQYEVFRWLEYPPADQEVAGIGGIGQAIGWRDQ